MINKLKTMVIILGIISSLSLTRSAGESLDLPVLSTIVVESMTDDRLETYLYEMARRESNNNAAVVNRLGFMGKYQFSPRTLWGLGVQFQVTQKEFLDNEELQDSAMVAYLRHNYNILRAVIEEYDGRTYNGIRMTTSGILAGAHLIGPYGIRYYFDRTYRIKRGNRWVIPRIQDSNGTHVEEYIERFSGYDLEQALD